MGTWTSCFSKHGRATAGNGSQVHRRALEQLGPLTDENEQRYLRMLKEEAQMDWKLNSCANAANWILLAGYVIIPGTFTSLKSSSEVQSLLQKNETGRVVLKTIQNPPLLVIAFLFFIIGGTTLGWLWIKFKSNYPWLINKIFIPAFLNAAAGLLTTVVNVVTSQSRALSIMSLTTIIVTALTLVLFGASFLFYRFVKLNSVLSGCEAKSDLKGQPQTAFQREEYSILRSALVHAKDGLSSPLSLALEAIVSDTLILSALLEDPKISIGTELAVDDSHSSTGQQAKVQVKMLRCSIANLCLAHVEERPSNRSGPRPTADSRI
ncbi:hypothetical protein N7456_006859 [Penicillium angulare]|uniref:Uncharacterized protein n=1 Tax=Penicillium angulare TaxID=116970 RepID=A0A9W9FIW3_9EURO|nr:hypothetical protein N7456_006859 [Penicillium angulare]